MHSAKQEQKILPRDGRYQIPTFHTIFTYYANPFDKQLPLLHEWIDWMFQFSLLSDSHYERRIREASIMTTSYLYPFCKDINRFERLFKWIVYLFILDDHIDIGRDGKNKVQIMHEVIDCIRRLEAIHVNGNDQNVSLLRFKPYIICAYYLVEDILLDMNMEQRKRFLKMYHLLCLAAIKEKQLFDVRLLDLDAISKIRLDSSGAKMLFVLIEYSEKMHISDHFWYDDRMQRLMDLCNLNVVFVNDVYSFEKEYFEANRDMTKMNMNIVGFHVLKYKCSIEEAYERSLAIIKEHEFEYMKLADSFVNDQGLSAECEKFVKCMTAAIGGTFAVSTQCNRYNVIYGTK